MALTRTPPGQDPPRPAQRRHSTEPGEQPIFQDGSGRFLPAPIRCRRDDPRTGPHGIFCASPATRLEKWVLSTRLLWKLFGIFANGSTNGALSAYLGLSSQTSSSGHEREGPGGERRGCGSPPV